MGAQERFERETHEFVQFDMTQLSSRPDPQSTMAHRLL